jgi:hypothetical protein
MNRQQLTPQQSAHDVASLFDITGASVESFNGKVASWANYVLVPFTLTTTLAWMVCDWFPTLLYGHGASSWLVNQLLKFGIVDSGLSAWLMLNFQIDISLETKAIGYLASAMLAFIWLMVSLIPSIGKHVLKLYAMNGMPYADYYRQALNLFDAVTDWPLAASVAWGGVASMLAVYLNPTLLAVVLWFVAGCLTWFFSSKLESLAISCFMTHYHLHRQSKVTRG